MNIKSIIAKELNIPLKGVENTVELLDEGNTIPFIARYRKELTGGLDEENLRAIEQRLNYLRNLYSRQEEVIRLIDEQGKLTEDLEERIRAAIKLQEIEDLYRPYRPKRRTRATIAKEKGLEPLALILWEQELTEDLLEVAAQYIDEEKGVASGEEALAGARDIIAEWIAEDPDIRQVVREVYLKHGQLVTVATDSEVESPYEMYYDYMEPLSVIKGHRVLAINRGEKENVLQVKFEIPEENVHLRIEEKVIINPDSVSYAELVSALEDGFQRLLGPSLERELRGVLTEKAESGAIEVFGDNLKQLLLQAPVKGRVVMGIDPAYRTGCKIAVVDGTGKLLYKTVIYPTPPQKKIEEGKEVVINLIERYDVDLIAIGNGTASRETESFVAELLRESNLDVMYTIVNEAGASVYSASPLAKQEFPNLDVAERSAISIARRVQDPLAELVKIDPKSIGVGQYQHDVDQKNLQLTLQAVVESAVNSVGVDLNTASPSLLSYVSGLKPNVARNIVKYRDEVGRFSSRKDLKRVSGLGEKTFVQCAGFLRIDAGLEYLDNTAVHPESYEAANALLMKLGVDKSMLVRGGIPDIRLRLEGFNKKALANELGIGLPTLEDIIESLEKPGRDPREDMPGPVFRTDVLDIKDLAVGMVLTGTVRNVVDFGAFVDIGVKRDGLVHISQLKEGYVRHPKEVVSVGDIVKVAVLEVDVNKERISLTMVGIKE